MIQWHLEVHQIKSLKPHPKNPRYLSKDQHAHLKESIQKFGFADKPIINTDHMIIGGHQRIKVLESMKAKTVECWVPDRFLDEKEVEELNIRLNRGGSWDFDILANEFEIGDLFNFGFTEDELKFSFDKIDEKMNSSETPECEKCPTCGKKMKKINK